MGSEGNLMICDWCGKNHSGIRQSKEVFHVLDSYAATPVICEDCYRKLEKTKSYIWKRKNSKVVKPRVFEDFCLELTKV